MKRLFLGLAAAVILLGDTGRSMADFIDIPSGGSIEFYWGPSSGGNQSYGEIFTVPGSSTVLNDYTLTVASDSSFPFVSQLYAWNGTTTIGPALFTSDVLTTTSTLTSYTFNPDISVTAGNQYIAFVTNQPNGVSLGGSGLGIMAQTNSSFPGAGFAFAEGNPAGGSWFPFGTINEQFHADFSSPSPAPVPSTLLMSLILFGMVGTVWSCKRLKQAASA
jgi:hypothetical protein